MGSVPKPRCARGQSCYHVRNFNHVNEPPKVRHEGDLCGKCEEELAGGYRSSSAERWKDEVVEAIQSVRCGKAVLWDLFDLDMDNGGSEKYSDFGEVLERLDAHTLVKLRNWLDENRDRAVGEYGYNTWLYLRTTIGLVAWLAQLPPDMQLLPDTRDGLPLQVVAVRTDGKKWDLNMPIRAELLRRLPRYFSERTYAKQLRIERGFYRKMRARMDREGFTLRKFTANELERFMRGEKRGRKPPS